MKFSDLGAATGVEDARVVALFGNQEMGRFCTKLTWQAQWHSRIATRSNRGS